MASLHSGSAWTDLDVSIGLDQSFTLAMDIIVCSLGGAYHFKAVSKALPSATAVALKQIIISLNMECGTHMIRSGKKQDLVDRLRAQFATWKSTNNIARWKTAKAIIDEARLPVAASVIFRLLIHTFLLNPSQQIHAYHINVIATAPPSSEQQRRILHGPESRSYPASTESEWVDVWVSVSHELPCR
jgi:hypothetical protein